MSAASYRAGPYLFDRAGYQVLRGGEVVPLTPKLLDLLFYLVDHAGTLVTKEELLEGVWPGANVTENALARAISEVRQVLGDEPSAPVYIKTIARRGYRFVAAVEKIEQIDEAGTAAPAGAAGAPLGSGSPPRGRDTPSLEAYRALTEGWMRLESLDLREIPEAISDLERAVHADPRYALAYAGLASGELALYESTRWDNEPRQDLLQRALDHARHAVGLDDGLAEAQATLALVLVSAGSMPEATTAARRAVALEPANWRHLFRLGHASWGEERLQAAARTLASYPEFAFSHFQIAMVHVARGRLMDAETILRQGAAVQDRQIGRGGRYPALGLHWLLGLVRLADDDLQEAMTEFDREEGLAQPHRLYGREYAMNARYGRAVVHLRAGRPGEAAALLRSALELYPNHAQLQIALADALRLCSATAEMQAAVKGADAALAILERTRPAEASIVTAQRRAFDGDWNAAAGALERLLDEAPPGFTGWALPVDPQLAPLGRRAQFSAVLTRLASRAR